MAVVRVVARLDPPSTSSFAITPLVLRDDGFLKVSGLSEASSHRAHGLTEDVLSELVAAGHARAVDIPTELSAATGLVAIWIGDRFQDLASRAGVPPPPVFLKDGLHRENDGTWGITTASNAWIHIEMWMTHAFSQFRAIGDGRSPASQALATAMRWTLPSDLRTVAASWIAARNPNEELAWQQRAMHSSSIGELEQRLNRLLRQASDPLRNLSLLAFSGGSGTERETMAREVTRLCGLGWTSFAEAVSRYLPFETGEVRKKALMRLGQHLVDNTSMTMVSDVMAGATLQPSHIVVVDSVRHMQILDLVKWASPKALKTVAIVAKPEIRRARLQARNLNPDEILSHPTEVQIQGLESAADLVFNDDDNPAIVAERLEALVA